MNYIHQLTQNNPTPTSTQVYSTLRGLLCNTFAGMFSLNRPLDRQKRVFGDSFLFRTLLGQSIRYHHHSIRLVFESNCHMSFPEAQQTIFVIRTTDGTNIISVSASFGPITPTQKTSIRKHVARWLTVAKQRRSGKDKVEEGKAGWRRRQEWKRRRERRRRRGGISVCRYFYVMNINKNNQYIYIVQ